ncbi:21 kDa protein-like [Vigna unguiculata]|uniref:Pectinesterase n=1 Tax=Vigna unguiculata TaxID=3917 RepID=A0A4D6L0R0_VIGUN|nr:21 kDa protein-like [Vigna unguiculata]QCD81254.1 pectinesterase [Vigna unguiculata]
MATKLLWLSLLILNLLLHTSSTVGSETAATDFIKSSCKETRYQVACVKTLSGYGSKIGKSEQALTSAALSASVSKIVSCVSSLKEMEKAKELKARELKAVRDCIENMNYSVDSLNRSVKELDLLGNPKGKDSRLHVSNVQSWVSAAITDQDTCIGSITDASFKSSIKHKLLDASHVTTNALALVNRLASNYHTQTP